MSVTNVVKLKSVWRIISAICSILRRDVHLCKNTYSDLLRDASKICLKECCCQGRLWACWERPQSSRTYTLTCPLSILHWFSARQGWFWHPKVREDIQHNLEDSEQLWWKSCSQSVKNISTCAYMYKNRWKYKPELQHILEFLWNLFFSVLSLEVHWNTGWRAPFSFFLQQPKDPTRDDSWPRFKSWMKKDNNLGEAVKNYLAEFVR